VKTSSRPSIGHDRIRIPGRSTRATEEHSPRAPCHARGDLAGSGGNDLLQHACFQGERQGRGRVRLLQESLQLFPALWEGATELAEELADYTWSKGTLQFAVDKPIPEPPGASAGRGETRTARLLKTEGPFLLSKSMIPASTGEPGDSCPAHRGAGTGRAPPTGVVNTPMSHLRRLCKERTGSASAREKVQPNLRRHQGNFRCFLSWDRRSSTRSLPIAVRDSTSIARAVISRRS